MSVHDECGPSVLHRRLACPGSLRMERGLPDEGSPAAARGTLLHAWAAHRLRPHQHPAPTEPITDAEQEVISYYVGAVRSMAPSPHAILLVEQRVRLDEIGIIEGGTVDAAWIDADAKRGVLFDLKTGAVPVKHPKWNEQTLSYAYGLLTDFGLDEVDGIIVQPTQEHDHRIRVARYSREGLWRLGMEYEDGIAATKDPAAPLRPGREQCEHCRARFTCEARNAAVAQTTAYTALANRDAVRSMTPAQRGQWWPLIVEARKRLDEIESLFHAAVIEERLEVDGYTVAPGRRGGRRWSDPNAALDAGRAIALASGKNPDDLVEQRVRSPAEFDEVLGKAKHVRERLAPLITQADGSPRLTQKGS